MVTAELAVGALLVAAMALMLIWLAGLVVLQQQAHDGAVQIARQQARGDSAAVTRSRELLDRRCTAHIARESKEYAVTVRCRPEGVVAWLPSPEVTATARIQAEPGQS